MRPASNALTRGGLLPALLLCCRAPKPHFIPVCHQLLPSKPPTPAIGGAAVKGAAVTATPTPMLGASPALGTRPGDKPLDPSVRRTIPASESTPNLVSTTSSTHLVAACMRPDCHTAADLARLGAATTLQHGSSSPCVRTYAACHMYQPWSAALARDVCCCRLPQVLQQAQQQTARQGPPWCPPRAQQQQHLAVPASAAAACPRTTTAANASSWSRGRHPRVQASRSRNRTNSGCRPAKQQPVRTARIRCNGHAAQLVTGSGSGSTAGTGTASALTGTAAAARTAIGLAATAVTSAGAAAAGTAADAAAAAAGTAGAGTGTGADVAAAGTAGAAAAEIGGAAVAGAQTGGGTPGTAGAAAHTTGQTAGTGLMVAGMSGAGSGRALLSPNQRSSSSSRVMGPSSLHRQQTSPRPHHQSRPAQTQRGGRQSRMQLARLQQQQQQVTAARRAPKPTVWAAAAASRGLRRARVQHSRCHQRVTTERACCLCSRSPSPRQCASSSLPGVSPVL